MKLGTLFFPPSTQQDFSSTSIH